MCLEIFLLRFVWYGALCASWTCLTISFSSLGKISTLVPSKLSPYCFFLSSSSGTPMVGILMHLILSQISLRVSSVLFLLFTLFCSLTVISSILPSSLLILSSASDSLLLNYFRVFLISVVMLFVSVSLFFNSSRDFFINSCTFSVLFSNCWSFYYHFFFLNPSSEICIYSSVFGLPCYSSFVWCFSDFSLSF